MTYRLYQGDCLDVLPTLAAGSVDAVICDLPYGTTACAWYHQRLADWRWGNGDVSGGEIMSDELRERIADVQHSIWAHWMAYMWDCGTYNADGTWTMPADKVERWQRQAGLKYSGLTEREKESDRDQADKVLAVLKAVKQ